MIYRLFAFVLDSRTYMICGKIRMVDARGFFMLQSTYFFINFHYIASTIYNIKIMKGVAE